MLRRIPVLSAARERTDDESLTAREQAIRSLNDEGGSNKDIARRLGIELATVKNHVHTCSTNYRCIDGLKPLPGCGAGARNGVNSEVFQSPTTEIAGVAEPNDLDPALSPI